MWAKGRLVGLELIRDGVQFWGLFKQNTIDRLV